MQDFGRLFDGVEDPRASNAIRHDLHEMLMIALLCMICGGQTCTDMELFGRSKETFLRRFMRLDHGIPSHDAFSRLFRFLDPEGLQRELVRLAADWAGRLGPDVIAIDGKALRRSFEDASNRSPLHVVNAFAAGARLTLGQVRVDGKSNEITAMLALLDLLDVEGMTVTADAMHTQRATAAAVTARGGDYVLALKGNQETLHDDVRLQMADPENAGKMKRFNDVGKGHGRIEIREAVVCHDVDTLQDLHHWPGLQAVGQVTRPRMSRHRNTALPRASARSSPAAWRPSTRKASRPRSSRSQARTRGQFRAHGDGGTNAVCRDRVRTDVPAVGAGADGSPASHRIAAEGMHPRAWTTRSMAPPPPRPWR